jgi:hypothetical protein
MSRATVFLSVLSASTIALALLADATGFGPHTTTLALVLLPVVFFLGIAVHGRLVEINREEVERSLAMNRLRHVYLKIAPALKPYFTTGHHDDEQGPVPGQHADDRRDGGRHSCGCDRRARGAGGGGRHDGRRGGGDGGVLVVWAALLLQ